MKREEEAAKKKALEKISEENKKAMEEQQAPEHQFPKLKEVMAEEKGALKKDLTPGYLIDDLPEYGSD